MYKVIYKKKLSKTKKSIVSWLKFVIQISLGKKENTLVSSVFLNIPERSPHEDTALDSTPREPGTPMEVLGT